MGCVCTAESSNPVEPIPQERRNTTSTTISASSSQLQQQTLRHKGSFTNHHNSINNRNPLSNTPSLSGAAVGELNIAHTPITSTHSDLHVPSAMDSIPSGAALPSTSCRKQPSLVRPSAVATLGTAMPTAALPPRLSIPTQSSMSEQPQRYEREHDELSIAEQQPSDSPYQMVDPVTRGSSNQQQPNSTTTELGCSKIDFGNSGSSRRVGSRERDSLQRQPTRAPFDDFIPYRHTHRAESGGFGDESNTNHNHSQNKSSASLTSRSVDPMTPLQTHQSVVSSHTLALASAALSAFQSKQKPKQETFDFDDVASDDDDDGGNRKGSACGKAGAGGTERRQPASSKVFSKVPTAAIRPTMVVTAPKLSGKSNAATTSSKYDSAGLLLGSMGSAKMFQSASASPSLPRDVPLMDSGAYHADVLEPSGTDSLLERSFNANELLRENQKISGAAVTTSQLDMDLSGGNTMNGGEGEGIVDLQNSFVAYVAEHVQRTDESRHTCWFRNGAVKAAKRTRAATIFFVQRVEIVPVEEARPSQERSPTSTSSPTHRRDVTSNNKNDSSASPTEDEVTPAKPFPLTPEAIQRHSDFFLVPSNSLHANQLAKNLCKKAVRELFFVESA